jgi:hypothetical protein
MYDQYIEKEAAEMDESLAKKVSPCCNIQTKLGHID